MRAAEQRCLLWREAVVRVVPSSEARAVEVRATRTRTTKIVCFIVDDVSFSDVVQQLIRLLI